MRNGEFSKAVTITLFKRAGAHCSICKKITSIPHQNPEKFHNLGEAAHIHGLNNRPNLRYDQALSPTELSSAKNGIWLCQACHHIIDNDAETYTASILFKVKNEHDQLIIKLHQSGNKLMPVLIDKATEVKALKKLIEAREDLLESKELIYDQEITRLKNSLSLLEKERVFFSEQLSKIKSELIDLNNKKLNALLSGGDINQALNVLNEEKLNEDEVKLGKARLLKARLSLSRGDLQNALRDFDKALVLWPSSYVAFEFIKVLYFTTLDFDKVVNVAKSAIDFETHPRVLIELNGQLSNGFLKLGRGREALECLQQGLKLLDGLNKQNDHTVILQRARLTKHIGDSYKLMGQINEAFNNYEQSLNFYFRLVVQGDTSSTTKEFAGLATAIGLLYEQNGNASEALIHHLRAKEVIKDDLDDDNTRALIFLNIATCYIKQSPPNLLSAKSHVESAIGLLELLSQQQPNENLEYLVGAKCQLADINIHLNPSEAKSGYTEALRLAELLESINPIFSTMISHVKHNNAVFLLFSGRNPVNGMQLLNESIAILRNSASVSFKHVGELSSALSLKAAFTKCEADKIKILKEIIDLNESTDPLDKNIIHKKRAEMDIANLLAEKDK